MDKYIKDELYNLVINFKRQVDVISGKAFIIGDNQPNGWFEAISTTGYCVKVSEIFLDRMLRNHSMHSNAILISIELDSNLFGHCSDGSDNAWHTAIDLRNGYVVDLTCSQFGSQYINRWLWKKNDWLDEFETKNPKMNRGIKFLSLSEYLKHG